ncbi:hypothetical protein B9Z19DRAFT_1110060 [Tuber borchii]|uniref:Sugar phosphate phosphatase n=1 Tax=Tuber borchii TaxID=42251 RepID=A0A2T6ZJ32_TUBBO|nr:hypothetical protein B9Z19DRAFT_1110060 [Tuber borchii]
MDPGLPEKPYNISDKNSFAYVSARDRWPVILTQAVDDVFKHTSNSEDGIRKQEGSKIVAQIAQLKYELQHDRTITPLEDDGGDDIAGYNEELEKLGNPRWFDAPWLFAECYLYRRLNTFFANSKTWKTHDVFRVQKTNAFKSSRAAVLKLASQYRQIVSSLKESKEPTDTRETAETEKEIFTDMSKMCLWGNATDLSLLTTRASKDIQKLQENHSDQVYHVLKKQRDEGKVGRVDIVLDNSGFELFVDLVLGGYLLAAGFATEIIFHPKSLPWFVSDVLLGDFADLINALRDPVSYFDSPGNGYSPGGTEPETPLSDSEKSDLEFLFSEWSELHTQGKFLLRPNRFWTTAASYWRLPSAAPQLFEDLRQSELVIFKGDLNYRKLTADAAWDPTTSFPKAIGELGKVGSGVRILALRTCKADVVVGLGKGKDAELRSGDSEEMKRKWAWSGKWAVIQFWDGKL